MKFMKRVEIKDLVTVLEESIRQCNENIDVVQKLKDSLSAIDAYKNASVEGKRLVDQIICMLARKTFNTMIQESMDSFRRQDDLVDVISKAINLADGGAQTLWQSA